MRVLVVDEEIPWPLNSGKKIRTFNLLEKLASRHEIVFLCRQHEGCSVPDTRTLEGRGIRCIVAPDLIPAKTGCKFYCLLMANLLSRRPYSVTSHYSQTLIEQIHRLLCRETFDLIHCEWTPYFENLAAFTHMPVVIAAHNVETTIWRRNYELEDNPLKKAYIYTQWKKMKQFEFETFRAASAMVVVSLQDLEVVSAWRGNVEGVVLVENGVDVDYFSSHGLKGEPHSIVFTGSLDWRPNVDAMLHFLNEIWPMILVRFPGSKFYIVGRNPLRQLKDRIKSERSVVLTGTVDDVRPYIEMAAIYVVPLRIGGGSRLKILEALAMKKPVVSTTVGAEGLRVKHGRDILIADGPEQFAEAIIRLFQEPELRNHLGSSGRQLVEGSYRWEVLANGLERAWLHAAECRQRES